MKDKPNCFGEYDYLDNAPECKVCYCFYECKESGCKDDDFDIECSQCNKGYGWDEVKSIGEKAEFPIDGFNMFGKDIINMITDGYKFQCSCGQKILAFNSADFYLSLQASKNAD